MANKREESDHSILSAVEEHWNTFGYGPSFRDLSLSTGLALGTVHELCRYLRDDGVISFTDGVARSLKLTKGNHLWN